MYEYLYKTYAAEIPICYLEFGVHTGGSLKWWLKRNRHKKSIFYGFDSFLGLPEFWVIFPEGRFDTKGIVPTVDDNRCQFIVGYFQDTLHDFLCTFNTEYKKIINLDADLYSSTLFILSNIAYYLNPGDVVIFDEFKLPTEEFKAFIDFQSFFKIKFKIIASTVDRNKVAFCVL